MNDARPHGSLSMDVDTFSCLIEGFESPRETIYEDALPRFLALLDEFDVRATLFVVGTNLERSKAARDLVAKAHEAGHEIANHSHSHFQGFRHLGAREQDDEIARCEEIIGRCTGARPSGFRAPGWNIDATGLGILDRRGYSYDSSVMPSLLNPLLKLAHRASTRALADGRKRTTLGPLQHILAPRTPYHPGALSWRRGSMDLLEIPITVSPLLRLPVFGTFSLMTGAGELRAAVRRLAAHRTPLNYEFHGVEFCDAGRDDTGLDGCDARGQYLPRAATMPLADKLALFRPAVALFAQHYRLVPLRDLARAYRSGEARHDRQA